METTDVERPYPKKRKRFVPIHSNIQINECVREFKLPQTYPSMIQAKKSPMNVTIERVKIAGAAPMVNLKVNSGKIESTSKLQKLKLKAPDGRDLGEFDVQVLPQVKGNKAVSVAVNQLSKTGEFGKTMKIDERKLSTLKVYAPGVIKNANSSAVSSVKYLQKSALEEKGQDAGPTHGMLIPVTPSVVSQKGTEKLSIVNDSGNSSKVYMMPNGDTWQMVKLNSDGQQMVEPTSTVNMSNIQNLQNLSLKNPMRPLTNGMKLKLISKTNSGVVINGRKRLASGHEEESTKRRLSNSSLSGNPSGDASIPKFDDLEERSFGSSNYYVISEDSGLESFESGHSDDIGQLTNTRHSFPLRTSQGKVNLIRRETKNANASSRYKSESTNNSFFINLPAKKSSNLVNGNSSAEESVDELSILGAAVNCLSEDLRKKALKALQDCGIGLEKLVPKKTSDQISIRESQTQTPVFGLLHEDEFVKASEDSPVFEKIGLTERKCGENKATQKQQSFSSHDLDFMLSKYDADTEKVTEVQNIMKFSPMSERIYNLLERDFANVKKYDENGFLNIHKAVLNNHVAGVKRQLMILKACKISVDVPTEDGQTSLELAMRWTESEEVIRLLVSAGANPTSSKMAHDSALTIAGRESSTLLALFIKHAPTPGDLNYVDSNGFAAIHYCAQSGNYTGVVALIEAGADLNVRDSKSGRTALFHALENDHMKITRALLSHGARPNIPNFSSHTVFHLIDDSKHVGLKDLLMRAMKM